MQIQHLHFSTQTAFGSEAVSFWVWLPDEAPMLLCQYWPSLASWQTIAAFPASWRTPLLDDAQAQTLRTILFLLGVEEVGEAVSTLTQYALTLDKCRQAHYTLA